MAVTRWRGRTVVFGPLDIGLNAGTRLASTVANRLDLTASAGVRLLSGLLQLAGANGQLLAVQHLTELTAIAAAATTDTTIQMPAGAIILGVSTYVQTAIPTAATFTVGDSGSAARFSTAAVAVAQGSNDVGTKAGAYYNASAAAVRITPNLTPGAATGRLRVTIHYVLITPATS